MMRKAIIFSLVVVGILSIATSVAYGKDSKKYYREASKYFAEGKEAVAKDRFHEAYYFFDKARNSAASSKQFERLRASELRRINAVIREIRNEQFRLYEVTGNSQDLIAKGMIARGMSKEHVILSWGDPLDISKKIYKWEELETWHYGNVLEGNQRRVYFKNGIVVDYKDTVK